MACNELENRRDGFYTGVRCGLLHQGETLQGWTISSKDAKALDAKTRQINAQKFLGLMRAVLAGYKQELIKADLDSELWKERRQLHLFVQETHQGDGEKTVLSSPTTVYVLEVNNK